MEAGVERFAPRNRWANGLRIAVAKALSAPAHMVFIVIAGLNCIFLSIITPPFQIHDEFQHYLRSYQLSEGHIEGVTNDGARGDSLPASLSVFILNTWGSLDLVYGTPLVPHPLGETLQELQRPLEPARTIFTDFSGAVGYWPVPYIPQALAMAVARVLQASPLTILFAGRLANAAAAIAMIAWALKVMPLAREATLVVALFPMCQFQYASVSPDALTIASAFAFTAVALRASLNKAWTPATVAVLTALGIVFCPLKPVYAPLLVIGLPALFGSLRGLPVITTIRTIAGYGIAPFLVLAVSFLWIFSPSPQGLTPDPEVAAKIAVITQHPLHFAVLLARTSFYYAPFYLQDTIGILGWFSLPLPIFIYVLVVICFVAAILVRKDAFRSLDTVSLSWNMLLIAAVYVLIEVAMFLGFRDFNKADSWFIQGVQGRYFLALAPLIAASLTALLRRPAGNERLRSAGLLVLPLIVVVTLAMDVTVITGFGILGAAV